MNNLLDHIQAGARAADNATMTGACPNRIISISLMRHGIAVEGRDTRKGGGIRHSKEVHRSWAQITAADVNAIEQAVEEVCAHLDRETGITLL